MRIDISLLPALAATFMLVFARVGAMVMLLPGFGESNIPVRVKLSIAPLDADPAAAAPQCLSRRPDLDGLADGVDAA